MARSTPRKLWFLEWLLGLGGQELNLCVSAAHHSTPVLSHVARLTPLGAGKSLQGDSGGYSSDCVAAMRQCQWALHVNRKEPVGCE
jgi:hypothetical protein